LLGDESAAVPKDERLVNWQVSIGITHVEQIYLNSAGAELRQAQRFVSPASTSRPYDGNDSQTRSLGRENFGQQGGADVRSGGLVGAGPQSPTRRCSCCGAKHTARPARPVADA
jgi:predicted Zn-dependent protease